MSSKAKKIRRKRVREGGFDKSKLRGVWERKPQVQTVPNKKAENRRSHCRFKSMDDDSFLSLAINMIVLIFFFS